VGKGEGGGQAFLRATIGLLGLRLKCWERAGGAEGIEGAPQTGRHGNKGEAGRAFRHKPLGERGLCKSLAVESFAVRVTRASLERGGLLGWLCEPCLHNFRRCDKRQRARCYA